MPSKTGETQNKISEDSDKKLNNVSRSSSDVGGSQTLTMRKKQVKKSSSKSSNRKTVDSVEGGGISASMVQRDNGESSSRPQSQPDHDAIVDDDSEPIDTEHQRVEKRQLKSRKSFINRMRTAWRSSTSSLKRSNSLSRLSFSNLFGSSRRHRGSVNSLRNANAENVTDVGKLDGVDESDVLLCSVSMLDGHSRYFRVDKRECAGVELLNAVAAYLNLAEKEYFGLVYFDNREVWHWLAGDKKVGVQLEGHKPTFEFQCRFYPIDPRVDLKEDLSRYYLAMQVRQDILSGKLPCSYLTLAILGAYAVQADLGDQADLETNSEYSQRISNGEYLKEYPLAPASMQNAQLLEKTADLHRTMRGMLPEDSDLAFLDEARKLALYGMDLHRARDERGVEVMLGVNGHGIVVYRDRVRLHTYTWPRILKVSYKRYTLTVTLRGDQFGASVGWRSVDSRADLSSFLDTAIQNGRRVDPTASFSETYKFPSYKLTKRCWRTVVEQHGFFRLRAPDLPVPPRRPLFKRLASSMRDLSVSYSGTTQAQLRDRELNREPPVVQRSSSIRHNGGTLGSWTSLTSLRRSQSLVLQPQSSAELDQSPAKRPTSLIPKAPRMRLDDLDVALAAEDDDIEAIVEPNVAERVTTVPPASTGTTPSNTFHAEVTIVVPPVPKRRKSKSKLAPPQSNNSDQLQAEQYRDFESRVLRTLNERHAAINISEADQIDRSEFLLIKQKSTAKVIYVDEDGEPIDPLTSASDDELGAQQVEQSSSAYNQPAVANGNSLDSEDGVL